MLATARKLPLNDAAWLPLIRDLLQLFTGNQKSRIGISTMKASGSSAVSAQAEYARGRLHLIRATAFPQHRCSRGLV